VVYNNFELAMGQTLAIDFVPQFFSNIVNQVFLQVQRAAQENSKSLNKVSETCRVSTGKTFVVSATNLTSRDLPVPKVKAAFRNSHLSKIAGKKSRACCFTSDTMVECGLEKKIDFLEVKTRSP
jgi:hypothetical protein